VERQIHDELGVHLTNGFAIVLAEVSNRLMVRNKPARDTPAEIINKLKQEGLTLPLLIPRSRRGS
jgi:hypothetical protein